MDPLERFPLCPATPRSTRVIRGGWAGVVLAVATAAAAAEVAPAPPRDPGKATIGRIETLVVLGTDGDPAVAGERAREVPAALIERLRDGGHLRFAHYRLLGGDLRRVYRSYENWAQPLAPSDEVLVRFEAQSEASPAGIHLDVELWLGRKKVLKSDVVVAGDRPVIIRGPEWRGGWLIVVVALAPPPKLGQ